MIPGIDTAAAGLLTLASFFACDAQPVPTVEIAARKHNPVYSNALPSRQLGSFETNTTFAKSSHEVFVTGGITVGKVSTKYDINFQMKTNPVTNTACLWVDRANINVEYIPEVYIASEYRPDSCRYKVTMEHEIRHVNTDIITLNEYMPRLQAAAQTALASTFAPGPLPRAQLEAEQQRILGIVSKAITGVLEEADQVRQQRQQQIDTRQEYLRLSGACPHEPNPIMP